MENWHLWIITAVIFGIIEMLTPGFVVLCFALGAVLAALFAGLGFSLTVQVVGFTVGTLIAFLSIRPVVQKWMAGNESAQATNIDRLIGMVALVVQMTDEYSGLVVISGEEWSARAIDGQSYKKGDRVRVVRIEGNKVLVQGIES